MDQTPLTAASLEQVLADWRGDAQRMRARKLLREADLIEQFVDQVAEAAQEYLQFVSEPDAIRRSKRSRDWLRGQFPAWERAGHARWSRSRKREYRLLVLPIRANESAAYEAGKQAGRMAS